MIFPRRCCWVRALIAHHINPASYTKGALLASPKSSTRSEIRQQCVDICDNVNASQTTAETKWKWWRLSDRNGARCCLLNGKYIKPGAFSWLLALGKIKIEHFLCSTLQRTAKLFHLQQISSKAPSDHSTHSKQKCISGTMTLHFLNLVSDGKRSSSSLLDLNPINFRGTVSWETVSWGMGMRKTEQRRIIITVI